MRSALPPLPLLLAGLALAGVPAQAAPSGSKNVIAQMFQWSWDSIATECTNFLGPSGYGYVQVSPPQESVPGTWFADYQPVSYKLISRHGNRTQFSNMVSTCHKAGVNVIVDSVWNHMTSQTSPGTGTAGDTWTTKYNYPGLYNTTNFHHCTLSSDGQIDNYGIAAEVWTCELDELADLATDTDYVRGKLAGYANDLISLGVDGLRLDAAKHQNPSDIANVLSRLTKKVYVTQETIWGPYDAVTPAMYTGNGDVQEFRYTTAFQQAFNGQNGGLASLQNLDGQGWTAGSGANVFVTNHDTERSGDSLNFTQSNLYTNAMVLSLAHPYGTPTILSSYTFKGKTATTDGTGDGAPNNGVGTCSLNGGASGWLCQHRWPTVASMTLFRNAVSGAMTNWVSPQSNQIAFGRGTTGYVAINNADSAWSATFSTSLPAGTYCNVITGVVNSTMTCSGNSFTVSSSGTFAATVPARGAIAIRVGQTITGPAKTSSTTPTSTPTSTMVQVAFAPTVSTVYGENVFVVGSIAQLGSWAAGSAIALSSSSYPVWKATVSIPAGTAFQYKYIKNEGNGTIVWESDPNRSATAPGSGTQTLSGSWQN